MRTRGVRPWPIARDLAAAKRLLDAAKDSGFRFKRIARGPDGPLCGVRRTTEWLDEIHLAGFSGACHAVRRRRSSLLAPGGLQVATRVEGDALTVLHTVLHDWKEMLWSWQRRARRDQGQETRRALVSAQHR